MLDEDLVKDKMAELRRNPPGAAKIRFIVWCDAVGQYWILSGQHIPKACRRIAREYMPIWNRQHGQCNFLLKWFVRMSLCTYGSQSLARHRYIDCDSELRHCMLLSHTREMSRGCDVPHDLPVVLCDWPLRLWGGGVNCCDHLSHHRLCSLPRPCQSCLHGWKSCVLSWTAMKWR